VSRLPGSGPTGRPTARAPSRRPGWAP